MSSSKTQAAKEMLAKFTLKAKAVVLNLSDVAIKAQEATNNEKWGPHGQLMSEIAEGSYDAAKFKEVWEVLRKRMEEGVGPKWRLTYKSLLVIEFLIKQSSQHVVQVVLENQGVIEDLQKFQFKDEAGKDWGLNVRNRAKELSALLANRDRLREERAKARANKEKYKGLSKTEASGTGSPGMQGASFEGGRQGAGAQYMAGGEEEEEERERGNEGGYGHSKGYAAVGLQSSFTHSHLAANKGYSSAGGMLMAGEEEGLEEGGRPDPRAATTQRINSLRQAGSIPWEEEDSKAGAAGRRQTAAAAVADAFAAFPAAEQPAPAAAKPSLRALTETKKAAPKKLGDVRVDPNIAAAFGGMKLSPAAPPAAAATASPVAAPMGFGLPAAQPSPQPAAPASFMDAFADFGNAPGSTTPIASSTPAPALAAFDDPFAVLSGGRAAAAAAAPLSHQILGSPAAEKASSKPNNPFASPTINLTATGGPLPEYFFAAPPPLAGYGSPMQGGITSPGSTGIGGSPASKPSPMRAGALGSAPASPAPAPVDDPFSAFNPFKH